MRMGRGIPQDSQEAYKWLSISAALGNKGAANARNFIANQLSPQELEKAQTEASELFKKFSQKK